MRLVRLFIVVFFLAVVPAAAALDAVAPQFLDSALGRKPRGSVKPAAPWEGETPLVLRTSAPEPVLRTAAETGAPTQIGDTSVATPSTNILPQATPPRENTATPIAPETTASPIPSASPNTRPHEPVYRGEPTTAVTAIDASTSAPAASPTDSQLIAMQDRLSALGASYMRLESTGATARTYRFLCQMQLSPSNAEVVPFEATASDPLEAMHRVLADVEAWQAMEITRLRR